MYKTVEKAIRRYDKEVQRRTGTSIADKLTRYAEYAQQHGSSARFLILDLQWEAMEYVDKWELEHES